MDSQLTFPFNKIAIAIGFTPRIEAILSESSRLQKLFKAQLIFIHIGDKTLQQEQYLKHLLHRFELDGDANKVVWGQGDPVEQIIAICEKEQVNLLVAGALEKESMLKYILGGVARNLCRKAKCSVLMLREPSIKSQPIKRIVVEGSDNYKTATTIEAAVYVAKAMRAEQVFVIQEEDAGKMAIIRSEDSNDSRKEQVITEELNKLNEILACTDCGNLELKTERLEGKPGYVITKFAREHNADLLVLNSPDTSLGLLDRVFPHDIEYALADLPCDLLIINATQTSTKN